MKLQSTEKFLKLIVSALYQRNKSGNKQKKCLIFTKHKQISKTHNFYSFSSSLKVFTLTAALHQIPVTAEN